MKCRERCVEAPPFDPAVALAREFRPPKVSKQLFAARMIRHIGSARDEDESWDSIGVQAIHDRIRLPWGPDARHT